MHSVSLLMLALIGPAQSLFLPREGNPAAFAAVGHPLTLDARGLELKHARMLLPGTAPPEGARREGSFRVVGNGEEKTFPVYRAVRWNLDDMEVRVTGLPDGRVEIQFLLPPGVPPERAFLTLDGATFASTPEGYAVVADGDTLLRMSAFRAFQGLEEKTLTVRVSPDRMTFAVPDYDPARPLVIDPITAMITGTDTVEVNDVKVARDSNSVYAAGRVVNHTNGSFSVNPAVFGSTNSAACIPGCRDAFVTHLSADMSVHLQTVILTSPFNDVALDLAVESSFVAVAGWTDHSSAFSVNRTVWGTTGGQDAFVVVMDSALSQVLHTFIVATPDSDQFRAVGFDEFAHVYAGGFTRDGANVPVSTAPHIYGTLGGRDAFAVSLSMDPAPTLMASAVLGGRATSNEEIEDLVKEPQGGMLYLTGQTTADSGFAGGPFTPGWGYSGPLGGYDAFFAGLSQDFTSLFTWVEGTAADEYSRRVLPNPGWSRLFFAGYTADGAAFAALQAYVHGPAPTSFGASFVMMTYPSLTPVDRAILTGASGNGATGLVVMGDRVALGGKVYDPQTFAPSRQIYGTLGGPDVYVSVLDTSLTVHHGTAVLASSGYDQANGLDLTPLGFVLGGYAGGPVNFAENPPTYFYGPGNTGRQGFVALIPGSEVAVAEGRRNTPAGLRIQVSGRRVRLITARAGYLALEAMDLAGRTRLLRVMGFVPAGVHNVTLGLPRGLYVLRVRSGDRVEGRKVLIP